MSKSTAEGLRVTLCSTLALLTYLTMSLGFRYMLTAQLTQDKLNYVFGIIR